MKPWVYTIFFFSYVLLLSIESFFSAEFIFLLKSIFLTIYLLMEISTIRKTNNINWMLNPVVLASFITFMLGYGILNLIYFVPDTKPYENLLNFFGGSFEYLSSTMDYIVLGAVSMWLGYRSNLGLFLFGFMTTKVFNLLKYFRKEFNFNKKLIYCLIAVSILVRFYAIIIGVYGYAQSPEEIEEAAGITQYLNLLGSLAQYSLFVVSIVYYSAENGKSYRNLFVVLIVTEVFFGFISGMKSLVILPFVIPLLTYLIVRKKLKKSFLIFTAVSVFLAYIIIEPFRVLRYFDPNFRSTPKYIIQTLYDAYVLNKQVGFGGEIDTESIFFAFLGRNNYMIEATLAIDYKNRIGLNDHDPDFRSRLFFAPLHAVVPRVIWAGKPFEDTGLWFTQKVLGYDIYSSTGYTPFGFLFFAGGWPFIVIFFFIFGIMQNALFRFLDLGSGGVIIYVGLLLSVILIDTTVNTIFITWIRTYPLLIILQYFTFKK